MLRPLTGLPHVRAQAGINRAAVIGQEKDSLCASAGWGDVQSTDSLINGQLINRQLINRQLIKVHPIGCRLVYVLESVCRLGLSNRVSVHTADHMSDPIRQRCLCLPAELTIQNVVVTTRLNVDEFAARLTG